ncbi:hypothetical protein MTR67_026317 [Solanum verrucosum]|uniref:Uncharacterized protein n=1 Tax=Solanum verrucosum TaxID=315347 RepID=A0AAF0TTU4_SOLVR|nr:hypothetical protein MTR67_026317 [Solanum verrucosum]
MAPYETLYGRRCKSTIGWFEVSEAGLIGPYLVHQAKSYSRKVENSAKSSEILH